MISRNKKFIILRNIFPAIVAILTCVLGYVGVYSYAFYKNQQINLSTTNEIIGQLDSLFTTVKTASIINIPLMGTNCEIIQPILKNAADQNLVIEVIDLIKDGKLYCSSNKDPNIQHAPDIFYNISLKQLPDASVVLLKQPFALNYKAPDHFDRAIITIVNDQSLIKILSPRTSGQTIALIIGSKTITVSGVTNKPPIIYSPIYAGSVNQFNYHIIVGFKGPLNLQVLFQHYAPTIITIIMLTIMAYVLAHWFVYNISNSYLSLATAIQKGEITAYVQPIYKAIENKREIIGVEVLARWFHPKLGTISPDTFIPMAERTGLIIPITQHLFKQVGQFFAPYMSQLPNDFHIGFNISRTHCQNLDLIDDCKVFYKYLTTTNVTLVLEITERELIEVTDTTKELFKKLDDINIKIALDDFGTGNSNLSYLYDFVIDYLKIDKSFVSRIGSDALSKNILNSIIEIAHNCNLRCCAEGVETKEQADYLCRQGVTHLQGYFFCRPMPLEEFIKTEDFKALINP